MEPPSPIALREIDLHGKTVDEAEPIVEGFLRESYRDNVRRVRMIHGKGIFVLQKAVREYLSTHKLVESRTICPAEKDHGGEGATEANLVEFKANE
jgi:DNA mismatch repair protein MutS2